MGELGSILQSIDGQGKLKTVVDDCIRTVYRVAYKQGHRNRSASVSESDSDDEMSASRVYEHISPRQMIRLMMGPSSIACALL